MRKLLRKLLRELLRELRGVRGLLLLLLLRMLRGILRGLLRRLLRGILRGMLLLLRRLLRGMLRGTSKPCICYLFVSNAKEAREMNDKGANMKHDEFMALADVLARAALNHQTKQEDARAALSDALAEALEPAGYEFRWTNPGGNPDAGAQKWTPIEARIGSTVNEIVRELQAYRYMGKAVYEVRPLFAPKEPT